MRLTSMAGDHSSCFSVTQTPRRVPTLSRFFAKRGKQMPAPFSATQVFIDTKANKW
jgi:hypothetical protein